MTATPPPSHPAPELVERVARAISLSRDLNPDCLYEHNFEGDWPTDERREFADAITGKPRVQLFHRAWRRWEKAAVAAIAALSDNPALAERRNIVDWLRADADLTEAESREIVKKLPPHTVPSAFVEWQSLVATKRGIADAIEREHHTPGKAEGGR